MSSFSDMMSAALAGLLSAALVHFGASEASDKLKKQPTPAQRVVDKPKSSRAPVPENDDRFVHLPKAAKTAAPQP